MPTRRFHTQANTTAPAAVLLSHTWPKSAHRTKWSRAHNQEPPSATATTTQDARQWWQQLATIGSAVKEGIHSGAGSSAGGDYHSGGGGPLAIKAALAPTRQVLEAAAVDDGKMSSVIRGLEQEVQAQVDAKMQLASDSHVYEQLSEDIKSKSAILAALKATLRPSPSMVRLVLHLSRTKRRWLRVGSRSPSECATPRWLGTFTSPHPRACPVCEQVDRPHTSPGRQKLAFAKREAALNLFRTMRQLVGS